MFIACFALYKSVPFYFVALITADSCCVCQHVLEEVHVVEEVVEVAVWF